MSEKPSGPIFVVGYMRSGTTLLTDILKRNREVYGTKAETAFFTYARLLIQRYPDLADDAILRDYMQFLRRMIHYGFNIDPSADDIDFSIPPDLWDWARQHRDHNALFVGLLDYLAASGGNRRWLEKTPSHIYSIDAILAVCPNAQLVEIVRDPRGVLASKKSRKLSLKTNRCASHAGGPPDPKRGRTWAYTALWDLLSWRAAVRAGQAAHRQYADQITRIRYRDLVSDPEGNARRLCDFLGLDFYPEMLDIKTHNAPHRLNSDRGVTAESVDRWTTVLSPGEIALCNLLVRAEMKALGFELAPFSLAGTLQLPFLVLANSLQLLPRLLKRWRVLGTSQFLHQLDSYRKRIKPTS